MDNEPAIKIFTGVAGKNGFSKLEGQVNRWLARNLMNVDAEDIIDLRMSTSTGVNEMGRSFVNCTILIVYRTPEEPDDDPGGNIT